MDLQRLASPVSSHSWTQRHSSINLWVMTADQQLPRNKDILKLKYKVLPSNLELLTIISTCLDCWVHHHQRWQTLFAYLLNVLKRAATKNLETQAQNPGLQLDPSLRNRRCSKFGRLQIQTHQQHAKEINVLEMETKNYIDVIVQICLPTALTNT